MRENMKYRGKGWQNCKIRVLGEDQELGERIRLCFYISSIQIQWCFPFTTFICFLPPFHITNS